MLGGSGPKPVSQAELFADLAEQVAQDRDRQAFCQLFDFFAPRIKAYLMKSGSNDATAEEITQDTLITLWHKAGLFDRTKSSLSTWLFRIARNRRIDLIRRDKSDRLDPNDPTLFPTVFEIAEEDIDATKRDERVRAAIKALPEEQALLIRLSFFEAKAHSQIAEELDLPLGTVKSRIRLAFNRLRKGLEADEEVDTD